MGVFKALLVASLKSQIEYRVNFYVDMIVSGLAMFSDFLIIAFMMLTFKDMGGWSLSEVAIIYSIVEAGWGIFRIFGDGILRFQDLIITGRFDAILVRPISTIKQLILQRIELRRMGDIIQAVGLGAFGITYAGMWNVRFILWYIVLVAFSAVIHFCINLLLATVAFWSVRNEDIRVVAFYSTKAAAAYPISIYGPFLRNILTFVIPLATIAYYPLAYLLHKTNNIIALFAPFITVSVLVPVTFILWGTGVKHYTSTGT